MKPESGKPVVDDDEQAVVLFWLRTIIAVCLFLASMSVLDALIVLFSYWSFLSGRMDPNQYQEWYKAFQEIHQSPFLFIARNLYNVVIWNGVIVCCIWLLRYHVWSYKILKWLLGLDMIVTVAHLLWEAFKGELMIASPGGFIVMNTMQVGAIIVLSHPRIVNYLDGLSMQQKQAVHSFKNSDL